MSAKKPGEEYSEAALSVYRIVVVEQLADRWRGEPYAVQVVRPDGRASWHVASDYEASVHGCSFGWDRVAAVVPVAGARSGR